MKEFKLEMYEFRAVYLECGPNAEEAIERTMAAGGKREAPGLFHAGQREIEALADTNANFAIIPYDVGFPPGIAEQQHNFFADMAKKLADAGIETLALITSSSYFLDGDYAGADWCARLPGHGDVVYSVYSGRAMACWNNRGWRDRLEQLARGAMRAGAGGVYHDFPCFGAAPVVMKGRLEGPAGCHCPVCRELYGRYSEETGAATKTIPKNLRRLDEGGEGRRYAMWRAGRLAEALDGLFDAARDENPEALAAVSVPHITALPVLPLFGMDPAWALSAPDICCAEHHMDPSVSKAGIIYESPVFKTLYAYAEESLPSALGHVYGPAVDFVKPPDVFGSTLAGGFACGVVPAVRGGKYNDSRTEDDTGNRFITDEPFQPQRAAAASLYNWLEKNWDVFERAEPVADTGMLFSMYKLQWHPESIMTPAFMTILKTLTEVQLPVRVLKDDMPDAGEFGRCRVIIVPWDAAGGGEETASKDALVAAQQQGARLVFIDNVPGWADGALSHTLPAELFKVPMLPYTRMLNSGAGRWFTGKVYKGILDQYGGFPLGRRAGVVPVLLSRIPEMHYRYQPPKKWELIRDTLVEALGANPGGLTIEAPPYIHVYEWKAGRHAFFHIVNALPGFPGPDFANLKFDTAVNARVITPAENKIVYISGENTVSVTPEPYILVEVKDRYAEQATS